MNVRLLKLVPAALAAYELRHLVSSLAATGAQPRGAHALLIALLALPLALILRESARGLIGRLPRVSWSLSLLATWLCCTAVVAATLSGVQLLEHGGALASTWPGTLTAALAAGLLLVVCIHGTPRLLKAITTAGASPGLPRPGPGLIAAAPSNPRRHPHPLTAGWSDRGPPRLQFATR